MDDASSSIQKVKSGTFCYLFEQVFIVSNYLMAGADDVFSVGPPEVVFTAVENFARDIQQRCGLQLNRDKTKVYTRTGVMPAGALPGLTLAGIQEGDTFHPGFMCYGVPVQGGKKDQPPCRK